VRASCGQRCEAHTNPRRQHREAGCNPRAPHSPAGTAAAPAGHSASSPIGQARTDLCVRLRGRTASPTEPEGREMLPRQLPETPVAGTPSAP
jgi:hypothetical protein